MTVSLDRKTENEKISKLMDFFREYDVKEATIKFRKGKKWNYTAHD